MAGAPYAVVVVNHRSASLLGTNLATTVAPLGSVRCVVVDNSPDADDRRQTASVASAHGWEVLTTPNEGFGAAVNVGVEHALAAGAQAVLVLNPDLELEPAAAASLLDAALAGPRTLVSPVVHDAQGRVWFGGGVLDVRRGRTRSGAGATQGRPVDWLSGACLAFSASAWRTVGGLDTRYFMYWEDVDLSWRARAAGLDLVVRDDVVAVHAVGGTQEHADGPRRSDLYYEQNCRNRLVFAAHHLPARDRWRWIAGGPGWARRVLLRGGRRQLLQSPRPVLAVLRGTLSGSVYAARRRTPWGTGVTGDAA